MDTGTLVVVLALFTLLAIAFFALRSKQKTEEKLDDPNSTKSTLAADKNPHGKPADV